MILISIPRPILLPLYALFTNFLFEHSTLKHHLIEATLHALLLKELHAIRILVHFLKMVGSRWHLVFEGADMVQSEFYLLFQPIHLYQAVTESDYFMFRGNF